MKRKGAGSRPPIPPWVLDITEWDGLPQASMQEQRRQWSAAREEWLAFYGYDVFDANDAELEWRRQTNQKVRTA